MGLSPELAFVVDCCGAAFDPSRRVLLGDRSFDWQLFVRLCQFHRVQGLVWRGLSRSVEVVPVDVVQRLSAEAAQIAAANLQSVAERRQLLTEFQRAEISLLFVKGLTLGELAYRTISIKAAVDIDILIEPRRLVEATAVLRTLGYVLRQPNDATSQEELAKWHDLRKESTWSKSGSSSHLDLHTRLADNPRLIPGLGVASPRQMIEVAPGASLPTLARDELFAYLAVHGASSNWFRIKWITDFAALIHGSSADELERLYDRSQILSAGRAPGQALLVADWLYGSLGQASALKRRLEQSRSTRLLAKIAMRQIAGSREPIEPTSRRLGTAAIHYSQFLLLPGASFKASEFVRQARATLV